MTNNDSSISVRIFGVPERMDCIKKNQKILSVSDDHIFIDYDHDGVIPTAKRTWSKETDKEFTMVLQDDIDLCDNFLSYCNRIVRAHPNEIIALFPVQFVRRVPESRLPKKSPYISTNTLSGCGVIMRTEYVSPCLNRWTDDNALGDDTNIQRWARENSVGVLTTIPSLIQHIGDVSVFLPGRVIGRTKYFEKDPKNVDWDNGYVTPWTNIIED